MQSVQKPALPLTRSGPWGNHSVPQFSHQPNGADESKDRKRWVSVPTLPRTNHKTGFMDRWPMQSHGALGPERSCAWSLTLCSSCLEFLTLSLLCVLWKKSSGTLEGAPELEALAPSWSHLQSFLYRPEKGSQPPNDHCHQQELEGRGIGVRCTLPMCQVVGCSPRRGSALYLQAPLCPWELDTTWPGKTIWQVEPKTSEGRKSFLLLFKQRVLHFHSARGPGNHLTGLTSR